MADIRNALSGHEKIVGREIFCFDTAGSTNTLAMEHARTEFVDGTVFMADSQTGGRGRLGRTWVSPPGKNISMSILLKPRLLPRDAPILTLMAAVACVSAIRQSADVAVTIKWPNDMMVGLKKLGGILTETRTSAVRIEAAVIGIGLNVNGTARDFPDDIMSVATTLRDETGEVHSRTRLAAAMIRELDAWYDMLMREGKGPVLSEWVQLCSTLGRAVRVTMAESELTGVAEGIDEEGLLVLRLPDQSSVKISAGDVTVLRMVSPNPSFAHLRP
ncbi:MAG TPA: biotin--[acetyl-CoA-carboxylase] ligase [Dissulfurispiraceae bacterium]|nr:biotin--[acetyl-CoA-carboxylase] ligase [Dissulfurispiraceae bacterium]